MAVDHVPALGSDVDTVRVVKWTKIAILRLATTMNVLAALRAIQRTGWKQMLIAEEAHHVTFPLSDGLDPQCGISIKVALDALMA